MALNAQMRKENEQNKQMRLDEKQRIKELDVKLAQQYVEMVDEQDRKKKAEFQAREDRVNEFMGKLEKGGLAQ